MPFVPTLSHEERTDQRLCSILSLQREERYCWHHIKVPLQILFAWRRAKDPMAHVPFLGAKVVRDV